MAAHYFLRRKFKSTIKQFSCVQSCLVIVSVMEGMMYNSPHFHQRDGAMMGTAMVACLSSISYNHADLL